MKFRPLLIASLAITTSALAQQKIPDQKSFLQNHRYNKMTACLLAQQAIATAPNKGTAVAERLIGRVNYSQSVQADTARFWYSGMRGSALNNLIPLTYFDDGTAGFGQTIDPMAANRDMPTLMYDSAYSFRDGGPGEYVRQDGYRQYTANTITHTYKLQLSTSSISLRQRTVEVFGYNGSGQLTSVMATLDTTYAMNGPLLPDYSGVYRYTGGQAVQDSIARDFTGTLEAYSNVLYSYAGGNMISALQQQWNGVAWEDYIRDQYTYTGANKLSTHAYDEIDPMTSAWTTNSVDTFIYTGSNMTRDVHYYRTSSTGLWEDGYATNSYYNATGSPDSQYAYDIVNGVDEPYAKYLFSYTTLNHYKKVESYYHNGSGFSTTPDDYYRFYYETFNTNGVKNVVNLRSDISLYPIPAKDVLNIRFDSKVKGNVRVNILNMSGQVVQQTMLPSNNLQLAVGYLATGNYIADISDDNGSQRILFVK